MESDDDDHLPTINDVIARVNSHNDEDEEMQDGKIFMIEIDQITMET